MSGESSLVLVERHNHVLVVTLNRPAARNSINSAVSDLVGDALETADGDDDIWAVVLTGAGETFCAGADLKAIARGENTFASDPRGATWGFAGLAQHHISTPLLCAVNGAALGGGTEIVLAADLAVAAKSATFGLPEVARGIFAGAGGPFRLTTQIPRKFAMEMLLTGETISAEQALAFGIVNRVVPDNEVLTETLTLADRICANAPLAVQATKRLGLAQHEGRIEAERGAWRATAMEWRALSTSKDASEGLRAFAEKRDPVWRGR